jgi:uncharacterized protein (TIGR02145 family)
MRVIIILFFFLSCGSFDSTAQLFGGQLKRAKGTITALTCGSTINSGNLYAGTTATAFTSFVPYSGGNGGLYNSQTISSTGITGLTAANNPGSFVQGSGYIAFIITGVPSATGTASFLVTIGGQSCTFTVTVQATAAQYPPGSVFCASGASLVVDVTNPTSGKTWMDRNLGATQVATSSTDANAYGDLYQWGRRSDGHQCRTSATTATATLSSLDQPANGDFILAPTTPFDWRNPQNANLWQGINGVNNPCPTGYRIPTEVEFDNDRLSWSSNTELGAIASSIKLSSSGYRNGAGGMLAATGLYGYYWTSSILGAASKDIYFGGGNSGIQTSNRSNGITVRCIKETPATLGSLSCSSISLAGNLFSGQAATGVTITVPYEDGNGGYYASQTINSTGVTGITASLAAGFLANGSESFVYTVSGTPATTGTATFALNIGGQICSFSVSIQSLVSQYPAGSVFCASGATAILDVTNPTTGKTWMDRNLGATQVATSSTDAAGYGDLYQWGRGSDGHQCRTSTIITSLSSIDQPAHGNFIRGTALPYDWRSPQNANLWQGVNGVNNPCPIGFRIPTNTELQNEYLSWNVDNSIGAINSNLKIPMAGNRFDVSGLLGNVGSMGIYWTSTTQGTTASFLNFSTTGASMNANYRAGGFSLRCIKETTATIGSINCGNSTQTGTVYSSQVISGVTVTLPYDGGNGGFQTTQIYNSTGVTGLTAALSAGLIASGSGSFNISITGTTFESGTANFAISIGGQLCSFSVQVIYNSLTAQYPAGSVFCASGPTAIVDVTNPTTGKIWMDRNLGASQAATSSTDANSYGDLYQWGRRTDGHQCRTSATTSVLSSVDQPGNGDFIFAPTTPFDWRNPQNTNLWQGVNGVNNPCPIGYRSPTEAELDAERLSWSSNSSAGAFASQLKLPINGYRYYSTGVLVSAGIWGRYWSSTVSTTISKSLQFDNTSANIGTDYRANAFSVRCIKDASAIPATIGVLNCGSTSITGTLTSGNAASGVSTSVPYTGGNGGSFTAQIVNSTGVTGLTATLTSGILANGAGSLSIAISGTPVTSGNASFALTIGGQSCSIVISVAPLTALISVLNCASATTTGTLISGSATSGVSATVPYNGGNGVSYSSQAISSTGVLGLTANLASGALASGAGNLVYTISGTPSTSGNASLVLTIGGQSCTLVLAVQTLVSQYAAGSVFCASGATAVVNVTSVTGKIWMDRNLGATQAATSSTDANSYGDLYQWGRRSDGHQCRTSITTVTLSAVDQPLHGFFIVAPTTPLNWRSTQNANLWQGVNGVNNPCPSAYRLPTNPELNAERISWIEYSSAGAFASPLKFPMAGYRLNSNGSLSYAGSDVFYWNSTALSNNSSTLAISSTSATMNTLGRAFGFAVRCIKD